MHFEGFSAIIAIFVILAIPIGLITLVVGGSSRFAHRKKQLINNVIIAEYEPPDNLSPAEVGYLFDSRLGKTELLATLLSLEQRSLVTINYSDVDGLHVCKVDITPPKDFKEHENFILANLSPNQEDFAVFSLKSMFGFQRAIKKSLAKQGYIKPQNAIASYFAQRTLVAYLINNCTDFPMA